MWYTCQLYVYKAMHLRDYVDLHGWPMLWPIMWEWDSSFTNIVPPVLSRCSVLEVSVISSASLWKVREIQKAHWSFDPCLDSILDGSTMWRSLFNPTKYIQHFEKTKKKVATQSLKHSKKIVWRSCFLVWCLYLVILFTRSTWLNISMHVAPNIKTPLLPRWMS